MPSSTNTGSSVVYKVNGTVTLKTPDLTVNSGAALKYAGDFALQKLSENSYVAQFLNFSLVKFDKVIGHVRDPYFLLAEDSEGPSEFLDYHDQLRYPVTFYVEGGKVGTSFLFFSLRS